MKIAFVSSEVSPFSKTGGLADVSGALPAALARLGHEVLVVTPLYQSVDRTAGGLRILAGRGEIPGLGGSEVWEGRLPVEGGDSRPSARVLFIGTAAFDRPGLYQEGGKDYPDNDIRFSFFSRACLTLLKHLEFRPDVFHVNDWQTALLPVYLKTTSVAGGFFSQSGTVLTIHNLAYQGVFPAIRWRELGLPDRLFRMSGLEFYGKINFLKGGIIFSDILSTVSPRYAQEICARSGGAGLEGVLQSRRAYLFGILNGVDYDVWNPARSTGRGPTYSIDKPEGKTDAKALLQEKSGLPVSATTPLFGCVTRLDPQKGCDILLRALFRILPKTPMQVVFLGTGAHDLEVAFSNLAKAFPGKVSLSLKFDNNLAQLIYSGSDFFLMPSKYEPCGLGQMISMAYGTIPVVRLTGGLADSVRPFPAAGNTANGIGFTGYSAEALGQAIAQSIALTRDSKNYILVRKNAMLSRFTWAGAADAYVGLYARAVQIQRKGGDERMAVALQEKPASTSLIYEIGANAGKVYQYLTKKPDGETPAQIAKSTGLESTMSAMAVGWLARENNVVIEKVGNRKIQVRLIKR